MKHKKVIFVCTGNTCRSPMAEVVLRSELKKQRVRWCTVQSAGLRIEKGSKLSIFSAKALMEAGYPVPQEFVPKHLTEKMIRGAYAVVCLTELQRKALEKFSNVTSFYQLSGRDIPDPYGGSIDVYRATLRAIRECMPDIIEKLKLETEADGMEFCAAEL